MRRLLSVQGKSAHLCDEGAKQAGDGQEGREGLLSRGTGHLASWLQRVVHQATLFLPRYGKVSLTC